jgi:nicotinate phosphoribosyltransferase
MGVSDDAPFLDTAYKLVEYAGQPRMKLSRDKVSLPGRKQVFRMAGSDVIATASEKLSGEPLLVKVMENGRRTQPAENLDRMRARCQSQIAKLPPALLSLDTVGAPYPVDLSQGLRQLRAHTLDLIKEEKS